MRFVRKKIEFCNKIRVSAFWVKIDFPLKRTKNKPDHTYGLLEREEYVDCRPLRFNQNVAHLSTTLCYFSLRTYLRKPKMKR